MSHSIATEETLTISKDAWQNRILLALSRVTSGGPLLPSVDGLRCVAILAVICYHLNGYVAAKAVGLTEADARTYQMFHLLHGANCGVQIFFAISGFILTLPFARETRSSGRPLSLWKYYIRRLTRIEPPFLINIALLFVLLVVVKQKQVSDLMGPFLATITYTHNFVYGKLSSINAVAWSLEIEVQFYLLAPFLLRWYFSCRAGKRRSIVFTAIVAMAVLKMYWEPANRLRWGVLYPLNHFLTGVLLGDIFVLKWKEQPTRQAFWDVIALLVLPAIFYSQRHPVAYHCLPFFTAALFCAALRGPRTHAALSFPWVVVIGGMCYSIYLYHFLVISLFGRVTMPLTAGMTYPVQMLTQLVLLVPPVLAVCAVFFWALEKPFMKWRPMRAAV
jgi:peptidoglycan/LPS O-acetylase OafA/YrhL